MKKRSAFYFFLFTFPFLIPPAHAEGLSTTFADILVRGVSVGKSRNVVDDQNHGLILKNLGDSTVRVSIQALVPQAGQLRPGAQPIPDTQWIEINPAFVDLPARGEKECTIVLHVPWKKEWRGKLFQVMIWSHGIPLDGQGMTVSAGLLSRVRFQIKD